MLVVLSQRIDIESEYADELFKTYHYPPRYRNQLHEGDIFVYYQGNRYDRKQRYYFGTGVIAQISAANEENYYATLDNCRRFSQKVPIYLPDGGYIEQLGYQEIRKSTNPPWQSSIRPLSKQAYSYILSHAGILENIIDASSVENMKEDLKKSIRNFFIEKDNAAILAIGKTAVAISNALNLADSEAPNVMHLPDGFHVMQTTPDAVEELLSYCIGMKMSYSYKPVLVMALLELHDSDWNLPISKAAQYFKAFYQCRRENGFPVEIKKCIYQNPSVTLNRITENLISNPVKALVESGYFEYAPDDGLFSLRPDLQKKLTSENEKDIHNICRDKLEEYYSRQRF